MTPADAPMRVIVYHHTHWDREWWTTRRDFSVRLADLIDRLERRSRHHAPSASWSSTGAYPSSASSRFSKLRSTAACGVPIARLRRASA